MTFSVFLSLTLASFLLHGVREVSAKETKNAALSLSTKKEGEAWTGAVQTEVNFSKNLPYW